LSNPRIAARQRILVVGGDGTIGRALLRHLMAEGHDVLATTRHRDRVIPTVSFLDLAEGYDTAPNADAAVICAAVTGFSECRNFPEIARRVNVEASVALCSDLVSRGARVIFLSTSAVFDCLSPFARGDSRVAPRSVYGRLKAEAEAGVLALGDNATILRLTKVLTPDNGVLSRWISELKNGQVVRAFGDHRMCPILLDETLAAIGALIERGESGVYQISGAADISFEEAARHLADRVGVPSHRVIAVRAQDSGVAPEDITPFTSLETSRLSALTGYIPPAPGAVIDRVFAPSLTAPARP
jgi:dTDP-4-dehydrorhamnose reductase